LPGRLNFCDFTANLLQLYDYFNTTLPGGLFFCDFTDTLLLFSKKNALLPEDEGPCGEERRAVEQFCRYHSTPAHPFFCLYIFFSLSHYSTPAHPFLCLYIFFLSSGSSKNAEESVEQRDEFVAITARSHMHVVK
jgi:hypothetical protein